MRVFLSFISCLTERRTERLTQASDQASDLSYRQDTIPDHAFTARSLRSRYYLASRAKVLRNFATFGAATAMQ